MYTYFTPAIFEPVWEQTKQPQQQLDQSAIVNNICDHQLSHKLLELLARIK